MMQKSTLGRRRVCGSGDNDQSSGGVDGAGDDIGSRVEFDEQYRFGKVIGAGSFGQVVRVLFRPTRQINVARRVALPFEPLGKGKAEAIAEFAREVQRFAHVLHPRILVVRQCFLLASVSSTEGSPSAAAVSGPTLVLATELAGGGELFDNIVECPKCVHLCVCVCSV